MPSPKSGKAGTPVAPVEPKAADEADQADPGAVENIKAEQLKTQTGKYGSEKVAPYQPYKPPQTAEEKEKKPSWIEIELKDDAGQVIPGEPYELVLPDGQVVASGTLDETGFARVDGIEPGQATVHFPNQEDDQWQKS